MGPECLGLLPESESAPWIPLLCPAHTAMVEPKFYHRKNPGNICFKNPPIFYNFSETEHLFGILPGGSRKICRIIAGWLVRSGWPKDKICIKHKICNISVLYLEILDLSIIILGINLKPNYTKLIVLMFVCLL